MENENFIFNDGTNCYFHKVLDSSNYTKCMYRGLNENYLNEVTLNLLIKPLRAQVELVAENNRRFNKTVYG